MPPFAELHCHSDFSFLDGASGADDLIERARQLNLAALAVTDHQGLYGAVRFATAAAEAGIRPIIGLEIELLDPVVPDPLGVVIPNRRRTTGARRAAASRRGGGAGQPPPIFGTIGVRSPNGSGEPVLDGGGIRPLPERLRLPGHRVALREDMRGVADGERGPHLVLLARDMTGYRSLCRLVSAAHLAGTKGVPRFSQATLERYTEGLVGLSGCRHGEIPRRLLAGDREGAAEVARRYARLFAPVAGIGASGGFFLELQHHLLPEDDLLVGALAALAGDLGLPTLVTNDAHYARRDDRELQDVLVAIRHGLTLDESTHLRRPNGEYHLKGPAELAALPPADPESDPAVQRAWAEGMATAAELAARCHVDLGFEQYRFPGFPVPRGETAFSYLEGLAHSGARRLYHPMTPAVVKQLAHELEVIERTGLAEFFLICWDLMRFSRERGIPAQGRGSAGDSIVAYVLGITRVDPIRHALLFERFINEGRTAYPDVDIDFATSRREEVIQYVYERYGPEHTGMVCNVVTYRARSAVREVGYALGFPRPLVDRVAKALETFDSVMVRRDLEAEGGFAEFFQAPGDGTGGAEDGLTDADRRVGSLARDQGLVDRLGQLNHERGGQVSTSGAGEHGNGRLADAPVAPIFPARHAPSDDEGGPGDTSASVALLRAEAAARRRGSGERVEHGRPGRGPRAADEPPVQLLSDAERQSPERIRAGSGASGTGGRPHRPAGSGTGELSHAQGSASVRAPASERAPASVDLPAGARSASGNSSTGAALHSGGLTTPQSDRARSAAGMFPLLARGSVSGVGAATEVADADSGDKMPRKGAVSGVGGAIEGSNAAVWPPGANSGDNPSPGAKPTPTASPSASPASPSANPANPSARQPSSTVGLSPWERWLELCARIDGFPRHLSIHTGGMLVTAAPLTDIAPLERATMPGRVVVQYDKRDVETIKLIKLDLLGLRMLSAIDDALRDIAVDCGVHVDLDRLPEEIPEVFRMIQAADTVGVFQIESRAQMQTLPKSRPESLDDLVVEVAIIRPGPIQGNAVHPYLRRKQGLEQVAYLHPSLEPILRETLGVILYQEQVMKIAIDVAGFSPAESDGFRRAMGTWRSTREMEKLHARFVEGCEVQNGLTTEQAEELYRQVAGFASFGFNKSHAAAFARTAYESAFLKLFYPAQFVTGLINAQPMGFYPVEVLINDAKRHGVAILPVDINRSRFRSTTEWVGPPEAPLPEGAGINRRPHPVRSPVCVIADAESRRRYAAPAAEGYGIRLGLHLVKGIGEEQGELLDGELERGPYRSLADLAARTELSEEVIERLVRAGALDALGVPRRQLLWQLREVTGATRGRTLDLRLPATEPPDLPPPTELERLGDSYAILSLDARRQVVELFRPALDRLGAVPASRLADRPTGRVAIGGLVVTRQHPMTARGTVFLALEDETGMVNVTLWPDTWARLRGVVRRHALLYVEGTLQREGAVINLVARDVKPLPEVCRRGGGPVHPAGVRQLGHAGMRRLG